MQKVTSLPPPLVHQPMHQQQPIQHHGYSMEALLN